MRSQRLSHDAVPDVWSIRDALISNAQTYSGNSWTDFNVHDPGVMLLEQIAYAITEIEYRASLDIPSRLCDSDGLIDLNRMRLAPPATVLCMQPVTTSDVESVLSGSDPSVAKVTAIPQSGAATGLYKLYVVPSSPPLAGKACESVKQAYSQMRNLCEDLHSVEAATPIRSTLTIKLEHQRRAVPEQIVAQAFAVCNTLLNSTTESEPDTSTEVIAETTTDTTADTNTVINTGITMGTTAGITTDIKPEITTTDAFDNPVQLTSGWRAFGKNAQLTTLLSKAVSKIPGVVHVHELLLHKIGENDDCETTQIEHCAEGEYLALELPAQTNTIELTSRGRRASLDLNRIEEILKQITISSTVASSPRLNFSAPEISNPLNNYRLPIAEELPSSYHTNSASVLARISSNKNQKSKQFLEYISLIDAILDETEGGRAACTDLYSESLAAHRTYIDSDRSEYSNQDRALHHNAFDPVNDRKSRALDRLLAMYGEFFTQHSLQHFDEATNLKEREEHRLTNKRRLLRALPGIEPRRGARYGFEEKLKILLGIPQYNQTTLTHSLVELGLTLLFEEPKFRSVKIPATAFVPEPSRTTSDSWPKNAFVNNIITEATLLSAARLSQYRIVEQGGQWTLNLQVDDWDTRFRLIDSFPTYNQAEEAANCMAGAFSSCVDSATRDVRPHFLIVEDILLRCTGSFEPMTLDIVFDSDIYSDNTHGYREFAEETASLVCPAHILPRFHWKAPTVFTALANALSSWSAEPHTDTADTIRRLVHGDQP